MLKVTMSTTSPRMLRCLLILLSAAAGCGKVQKEAETVEPPAVLQVVLPSATLESAIPAELKVLPTAPPVYKLSLSAAKGATIWSAAANLSEDQVFAGGGSFEVKVPWGTGRAIVSLNGQPADDGVLNVEFRKGIVEGRASGMKPGALNATFSGKVSLSCWVPASLLAPQGGSIGGGGGEEALVEDTQLVSAPCAPFREMWQ